MHVLSHYPDGISLNHLQIMEQFFGLVNTFFTEPSGYMEKKIGSVYIQGIFSFQI